MTTISVVVKGLCNKPEGRGFIPAALGPGIHSASNRHEYQLVMFLGSKARPMGKADNLSAICEPIVQTVWGP
jgi:hypothetical protein